MAFTSIVVPVLILLEIHICLSVEINRADFPNGFLFGTASSAFQYEGAVKEDGRAPSVWDTFSHTSGKVIDFSNADVAVDHYHRFEEDIQLMKDLGMDAYRLSISWSFFPAGMDHYNKLINALLAKGIEPYVTLYHWDLPQALEDKYKGWLSTEIIKDFATFAERVFRNSGTGAGNSATEPYIVAHNVLISHASVADIYRKKYKGGSLGIAFDVIWFEPATNTQEDIEAAQRAQDFQLGWFVDPLMFGDYPSSMRSRVGNRLPKFSPSESTLVKGMDDPNSILISMEEALKDEKRIRYYSGYLSYLQKAIKDDGCNVKGYFAWSWIIASGQLDTLQDLVSILLITILKRYPKQSVQWFKNFLKPAK
ncbi:hypothetical protein KIW84_073453 [Lathyrus oleraceus]|uniref:Beta-glucosidase n=1 Tax=Pisum sativum TaxID=3888 RepID=A0A9D4VP82_PEA|nr:hypothetical protein KIW84_073453 [Pisum sativum]